MKHQCKNCFFWKQRLMEPEMGECLKASPSGATVPMTEEVKPVPKGIAIRPLDKDEERQPIEVLFGMDFGCIYWKNRII